MLSSPLAGILRVGVVLLAAGALAGGVYLLAQADDERTASSLEAPTAIAAAPEPLSPPADIDAPPDVDTSDWLTYTSPLGFTIKYPPDWVAEDEDPSHGLPLGTASIINEKTRDARALRSTGETGAGFRSGEALIQILPLVFPPEFDEQVLLGLCGGQQMSVQPVAGRAAVRCSNEGPSAFDETRLYEDIRWVERPLGGVLHIGAIAADADEVTLSLLRAIFATVSFENLQ